VLNQVNVLLYRAFYLSTKFIQQKIVINEKIVAIFLNLAKAFDVVDHTTLIKILPNFGIID